LYFWNGAVFLKIALLNENQFPIKTYAVREYVLQSENVLAVGHEIISR